MPDLDFRLLLDNLHTAVVIVDEHLNIYYLNAAGESLFEIGLMRAKGQSILPFFDEHDDYQIQQAFLDVLQSAQSYTSRESAIYVNLRKIYVDFTVSALSSSFLLIELDVIDKKVQIAQEEQTQQHHQIARHLIRSLAHEIKNPLGGIRGATQLLARQLTDEQLQQFTDIIIHEVDRLSQLTDAMLGSRQSLHFELINIHEPLERVRTILLNHLHQTESDVQIEIKRDYDLSLPEILADRHQLIQVLLNITMNAVQAIEENPQFFENRIATLTLKTRVQRLVTIHGVLHRSVLRVDIIDNGIGIPKHLMESIFYPLITGRATGAGLGLSIAQNIVHQHQGMLTCQSQEGHTMFSLYLPWEQHHVKS